MFDITKLTKLFCEHPPGKVFQGLVTAILPLMFFEQYTDTFKLAKLKSAAEIVKQTEDSAAKASLSHQIQNEVKGVLTPQSVSAGWKRLAGGWVFFFFVSLLWWQSDKLGVLRINLYGLVVAILIALLPDFFPSMLSCLAVSGCLLLILITIAVQELTDLIE